MEIIEKLLKVAEDLKVLSESIHAVCTTVTEGLEVSEAPKQIETVSLEKVRGVLADKSRAGHTAEVRAIIAKHGADRLSDVDPKHYAEILAEAEGLADE
ncbi:MAG: rRNA biogenesis protein rrp5 [Clostridiales bacterium]|nr:rRNA biogenesis protein rrp5 [Clostridiales bacterium]